VFPSWLGTVPALAKAFLEQVMRTGVAFAYEKYGAKILPNASEATKSRWLGVMRRNGAKAR
jgi:putative NADPH-quinone reductase